ncbi:hypothetical protein HPB49_012107 [Dermacentor silvarum]|uniref:Uncharacterized protein n=1 Tax=Dermacentor silvarum TaxID=543639 RepID=A0ACB8CR91_DERSI|nr:hypothetical protein HPB49_012107 [Dermacentor silvarum]
MPCTYVTAGNSGIPVYHVGGPPGERQNEEETAVGEHKSISLAKGRAQSVRPARKHSVRSGAVCGWHVSDAPISTPTVPISESAALISCQAIKAVGGDESRLGTVASARIQLASCRPCALRPREKTALAER